MTKELKIAFEKIREYHPEVTMVVFNVMGQWFYSNDSFEAPSFDGMIDQAILEDAADSIDTLPSVYRYE